MAGDDFLSRWSRRKREVVKAEVPEEPAIPAPQLEADALPVPAVDVVEDKPTAAQLGELLAAVREGKPLSRAMADRPALFSPTAAAMAEAGEANGRLGDALARLATMLEQAAELRRLVGTSMIYPIALLVIAVGVVLMMLLFVVPQFENLFANATVKLPAASRAVMAASQFVRRDGLWLLGGAVAAGFGLRLALRQAAARRRVDALLLRVPQVGELIRRVDAARFSHTMGALLEGGVPLPTALLLGQRTVGNGVIAAALGEIAMRVKEGGSLTTRLAAANVFPRLAIGFVRTGEETSQLGPMLSRLAEVLDRDVKVRLQRLIAILTPVITVVLGATVAAIIAAIMSAILGFNDLAVSQ